MALYEFSCPEGHILQVRAPMSTGPGAPSCDIHDVPMLRIYGVLQEPAIVQLSKAEYIDKAYRGEEAVPGLKLGAIRQMVDNDVRHAQRGRANERPREREGSAVLRRNHR